MSPSPERRRHPRLSLRWVIALSRPGDVVIESVTENLSRAGFYCYLSRPVELGETLDCVLNIPTSDFGYGSNPLRLRCHAQVVRVDPGQNEAGFGVACRIDDYEISVPGLK